MKKIQEITADSFSQFGYIIAHDQTQKEPFQIVLKEEEAVGWRIAVSKITHQGVNKIARHPNSMETFEPLDGVPLICVAAPDSPEDYQVFLLDKPVCLYKNVWHATFTLSSVSSVKICENLVVESEEYNLKNEIKVGIYDS